MEYKYTKSTHKLFYNHLAKTLHLKENHFGSTGI